MKIYLDTIGCRLNQSEIEIYARQFRSAGHTIVPSPEDADIAVVNTCTVTAAAGADSRKKIRHIHRAGVDQVIVTGCWSELEPDIARELHGVQQVISNADKHLLVPQLLDLPPESFDQEPILRKPIPGSRLRTRAFIKAQDGCDNRCTFCITTIARGSSLSRSIKEILFDINSAILGGTREIVLTGVHLGSWGHDFDTPQHLRHLVETILRETDVPRLRLSSIEPWDLDAAFFDLWSDKRLARHLHLPLQSGSDAALRRMARKITSTAYAQLLADARSAIPEIAITSDIIVGFPGETDAEFAESLAFVEEMEFSGGHVFTYSKRPGTAAALMPDQVNHNLRKERNARMRDVFAQSASQYQSRFIGKQMSVLWESASQQDAGTWTLSGLTDNYLRVTAEAPQQLWNRITPVNLTHIEFGRIIGTLDS